MFRSLKSPLEALKHFQDVPKPFIYLDKAIIQILLIQILELMNFSIILFILSTIHQTNLGKQNAVITKFNDTYQEIVN